ncbi:g-protein beta wd-40 repeats containing [Colletotrichum incanum]|uniref:G-protein beta wd-40 repeats containing n=1 Tax=Colletotrichum incanum TaxID=1573173 RepID=A0A162NPL9_COLIC|nr:g-protein beta wd-40 repeats containing [Colletotrichum incanum]
MSDPNLYTIGWICVFVTEYVAAQVFLDEKHEPPESISAHDSNKYTLGRMGKHNVVIAALPDGRCSFSSVTSVTRDMLHSFKNIRVELMFGIGGGAPSPDSDRDIRLGNIVVSPPAPKQSRGRFSLQFRQDYMRSGFSDDMLLESAPEILGAAANGLNAELSRKATTSKEPSTASWIKTKAST